MKRRSLKSSILIFTLAVSNFVIAQQLDLSGYELKAHYELSSDGIDFTGNYDTIELDNPIFEFGGILSRGCYVNSSNFGDSCLIETPEVNAMNDLSFAIQVDFRLSSFNKPIIIAGHGYRYLGIETNSDGSLFLRTNNSIEDDIENIFLEQDEWYNITLLHNTLDSNTYVYLNQELIFTKKKHLNHPDDDNEISNSNFSAGRAFKGYWKELKVYSTNMISSVESSKNKHEEINVFPNPANTILNFDMSVAPNLSYAIFDTNGRCMERSNLSESSIDITNLFSGIYIVAIYDEEKPMGRAKFIKQ